MKAGVIVIMPLETKRITSCANVNILTDEECKTLLERIFDGGTEEIGLNLDYELCAQKKHPFPNSLLSFLNPEEEKKYELKETEELNLPIKPNNYRYSVIK